jgi:hypothetical protein
VLEALLHPKADNMQCWKRCSTQKADNVQRWKGSPKADIPARLEAGLFQNSEAGL